MPRRPVASLLVALERRARPEVAARLRLVLLLLLLAELHAGGGRNERRAPWMRTGPTTPRPRGPRPQRASQCGRRPRG
ncbi:MAG: hypothetical protein M3P39_06550 [Actinomycetota bacterium]|nr:hypothetical protein [Actinomycetota bacterium]